MCIFCKIVEKEIPSFKIYENEYVYAFLDIANDYYGHTLVVPKKHFENIINCNENELKNTISSVQKICNHYNKLGFSGMNVLTNTGKSSGQEVMHLHFHIIPRKDNDGLTIYSEQEKLNLDLNQVCNQLKMN